MDVKKNEKAITINQVNIFTGSLVGQEFYICCIF